MISAIWGTLFAVFLAGVTMLAGFQSTSGMPTRTQTYAQMQAQSFEAYRNACLAYVEANPGWTGSIPVASLTLPPGMTPPPGAQNLVSTSGTTRLVQVWAALLPQSDFDIVKATGDESYGLVENTQWVSPVYGVLGAAPAGVPNGDTLSQLGTD